MGFKSGRLKTGTPPRINKNSIDWNSAKKVYGDKIAIPFSYRTKNFKPENHPCHSIYTTSELKKIILSKGIFKIPKDQFSRESIQGTIYEIEALNSIAKEKMLEKLGIESLNEDQEKMLSKLCESVVCASEKENWQESIVSCVNNFTEIEKLGTLNGVFEISDAHKLELYPSAILYHSNESR